MEDQEATRLAQEEDAQLPEAAPAEPEEIAVAENVVADADDTVETVSASVPEEAEEDTSALRATLEAIVYITDEPLTAQQMAAAIGQPIDKVKRLLDELVVEFEKPEHGLSIREVAGGYKMATKAEHHEAVRAFVKKLTPPLKLSLAALETLAVIAYKQPVTAPEIMDIRGVQGAGVLKTLLDRKLIQESGRKKVIGQPILYKTTKEFLVQFGLNGLSELPTLKEFEELGRMELVEEVAEAAEAATDAAMAEAPVEPAQDEPQEATSTDVTSDASNADAPTESTEETSQGSESAEVQASEPEAALEPESVESESSEEQPEEKAAENA